MYLTAHHVVSPVSGDEGINAFHYEHGSVGWQIPPPDIPDQRPGTLVNAIIAVEPPGNRVRSYLDIVAPDDAPWPEIRQSFITFLSQVRRQGLPWVGIAGRCLFRIGIDMGLAHEWQRELADLYRAVQAVRPET
jgi:hypothetical protein